MREYRKVKIRMTVEYEVEIPADWTAEDVTFHRNDSSWCANNAIEELRKVFKDETSKECMCWSSEFEFLHHVGSPYVKE